MLPLLNIYLVIISNVVYNDIFDSNNHKQGSQFPRDLLKEAVGDRQDTLSLWQLATVARAPGRSRLKLQSALPQSTWSPGWERGERTTGVAQFSCLVCTPGHTAALGRVATTYIIFCTVIKLKHSGWSILCPASPTCLFGQKCHEIQT